MRGSGNLLDTRFNLGVRYIPDGVIDRATLRTTLMYRLSQDLQLGVEYNPLASEVGPLANYRLVRETRHRPALMFGTSSDRIGTPRGHAYYGTLSKDIQPYVKLPVSLYAGALYGTWDDELIFPFGANVRLGRAAPSTRPLGAGTRTVRFPSFRTLAPDTLS